MLKRRISKTGNLLKRGISKTGNLLKRGISKTGNLLKRGISKTGNLLMQNGVDGPAGLLRFVTLVHWLFSVRSLDHFCGFTRIHEGHFVLC